MKRLCIVRRGHMGDVILTEPVVSALVKGYDRVVLYTEFLNIGHYLAIYDEVLPFSLYEGSAVKETDTVISPLYEIYPGCNHLDGFARSCGVSLERRLPNLRSGSLPVRERPYILIAPDTSFWIREMRQWPRARFAELARLMQRFLTPDVVFLEPSHSFAEMMALIEHCEVFVGNDSGPAMIAQCYSRPTFVLFGATLPSLVLLSPLATALVSDVGCNGCKHFARHTDITCATPICLESLCVKDVIAVILERISPEYLR